MLELPADPLVRWDYTTEHLNGDGDGFDPTVGTTPVDLLGIDSSAVSSTGTTIYQGDLSSSAEAQAVASTVDGLPVPGSNSDWSLVLRAAPAATQSHSSYPKAIEAWRFSVPYGLGLFVGGIDGDAGVIDAWVAIGSDPFRLRVTDTGWIADGRRLAAVLSFHIYQGAGDPASVTLTLLDDTTGAVLASGASVSDGSWDIDVVSAGGGVGSRASGSGTSWPADYSMDGEICACAIYDRIVDPSELVLVDDDPEDEVAQWFERGDARPVVKVEIKPIGEGIPREDRLIMRLELNDRLAPSGTLRLRDELRAVNLSTVGITARADGHTEQAAAVTIDGVDGSYALAPEGVALVPDASGFQLVNARLATTENIERLAGLVEVDGVAPDEGDFVLVGRQHDHTENGLFSVHLNGAWTRRSAAGDSANYVPGSWVEIDEGDTLAGTRWAIEADVDEIVYDSTPHTWGRVGAFSISTSIKPNIGSAIGVFSLLDSLQGYPFLAQVDVTSAGAVKLAIADASTVTTDETTEELPDATWSHVVVAAVADGATDTTAEVYREGAAMTGGSLSIASKQVIAPHDGAEPYVFSDTAWDSGDPVPAHPFDGDAEHLYVWGGHQLTPDEVEQLQRWVRCNRFRATSAEQPIDGLPCSIQKITPIRSAIDVATGTTEIGELEISASLDDWFASLTEDYSLRGAEVTVWLGDQRMEGTSQFSVIFRGELTEWIPQETCYAIRVRSLARAVVERCAIDISAIGHPAEIARELVTTAAARTGIDQTIAERKLLDLESFDPSLVPSRGHWNMSRRSPRLRSEENLDNAPQAGVGVSLDELVRPVPARLVVDPEGRFRWVWIDDDAEVDHLWTEEDVKAFPTVERNLGDITNSLTVRVQIFGLSDSAEAASTQAPNVPVAVAPLDPEVAGGFLSDHTFLAGQKPAFEAVFEDRASIARYGRQDTKIGSRWLSGIHDVTSDDGENFYGYSQLGYLGVCGFGLSRDQRRDGGTQEVWRQLNEAAGRALTVFAPAAVFTGPTFGVRRVSVMRAYTAFASEPSPAGTLPILHDPDLGDWPSAIPPMFALGGYGVTEFGLYGTHASAQTYPDVPWVCDLTIPAAFAEYYLRRFSSGCPVISFPVGLDKYSVAVGDKVSLDYPLLKLGRRGVGRTLSSTTVWEVIGVDVDPFGSAPGVVVTLAWLRDDTAEPVDLDVGHTLTPLVPPPGDGIETFVSFAEIPPQETHDDLALTLSGGALQYGPSRRPLGRFTRTVLPSTRTYVVADVSTGAYTTIDVGAGGDPPDLTWRHVAIGYADSDATEITAWTSVAPGVESSINAAAVNGLTADNLARGGVFSLTTTDDTPTDATGTEVTIAEDTAVIISGRFVAVRPGAPSFASWAQELTCHAENDGGSITIVSQTDYDDGDRSASFAVTADGVVLQVTGTEGATETIHWAGAIEWEAAAAP